MIFFFRILNWNSGSVLHLHFYILDRPEFENVPVTAVPAVSLDEAVMNLNRVVNQNSLLVDLSGTIGITARFKAEFGRNDVETRVFDKFPSILIKLILNLLQFSLILQLVFASL